MGSLAGARWVNSVRTKPSFAFSTVKDLLNVADFFESPSVTVTLITYSPGELLSSGMGQEANDGRSPPPSQLRLRIGPGWCLTTGLSWPFLVSSKPIE